MLAQFEIGCDMYSMIFDNFVNKNIHPSFLPTVGEKMENYKLES